MIHCIAGVICAVLVLSGVVIWRISIIRQKHEKALLAVAVCLGLVGAVVYFSIIPIVNLVTHFRTPEEAFKAASFGQIRDCVDGQESNLIVYYEDDAYSDIIILQTDGGYKLTDRTMYANVYFEEIGPYIGMKLFRAKESNEYYFSSGVMFDTDNISVSDSKGSDFQIVSVGMDDIRAYFIYGYVGEITSDYYIMFGDEKLRLAQ